MQMNNESNQLSPPEERHTPTSRTAQTFSSGATQVGANVSAEGVIYRIWAPAQTQMKVFVQTDCASREIVMARDGVYWASLDPEGKAGDRYRFVRADGKAFPDVASRFQPEGVEGPSECIDPSRFVWRTTSWKRPGWTGQVIYELHVGTFTPEGTYAAAAKKLPYLAALGVGAIELMPLADFPGDRNWGYDCVSLYSPARCYGRPDDLRAFVDKAHEHGLAVVLDVVYNHVGPRGSYLKEYCEHYFGSSCDTPWGASFNLCGEHCKPVRDFLIQNAIHWLEEYRFDGFRLDATHAIPDSSCCHLVKEITEAIQAVGAFVTAEDDRNAAWLCEARQGDGFGLDALWADDFHHQLRVALTGIRDGYYGAYEGAPSDLVDVLRNGWTYRGQSFAPGGGKPRGTPCEHLPTSAFIVCIENHDQVGNRPDGARLSHLVAPRHYRAASLFLCLGPFAPLLFMGQEWGATSPFPFFSDYGGSLGAEISAQRLRELSEHGIDKAAAKSFDPEAAATFECAKLRWEEHEADLHKGILALYKAGLAQRRNAAGGYARHHWKVDALPGGVLLRNTATEAGFAILFLWQAVTTSPFADESSTFNSAVLLSSEEPRFGGELQDHSQNEFRGPGCWLVQTHVGGNS